MSNYLVSASDLTAISLGEQDTVTSVLQNIAVILSTPKGTVPGYREFGIDISDILDRPETYMGTTFKTDAGHPGKMLPVVEVSINA